MKGQDRTLSIRMKGAEVALLHEQLQRLGYIIPQNEIEKQYFGAGTNKAVLEVQKPHGLKPIHRSARGARQVKRS
jgi:peptidoglycan hydrolase-like protein with peptidoglycan-binding domain